MTELTKPCPKCKSDMVPLFHVEWLCKKCEPCVKKVDVVLDKTNYGVVYPRAIRHKVVNVRTPTHRLDVPLVWIKARGNTNGPGGSSASGPWFDRDSVVWTSYGEKFWNPKHPGDWGMDVFIEFEYEEEVIN